MSTILIVVGLIVVLVIAVAAVLYAAHGRGRRGGLRRRFGPEYDRAVARANGDTAAAEAELAERVRRHGGLRPRPLAAERRDGYSAEWAALQERFVDAPRDAVAQAERLVAGLAAERGYPASGGAAGRDDLVDALSVHHAYEVDGYRKARRAASSGVREAGPGTGAEAGTEYGTEASTEELREALIAARGLFDRLLGGRPGERRGAAGPGAGRVERAVRKDTFSMRPKGSSAS
jgi:hypothetical protein